MAAEGIVSEPQQAADSARQRLAQLYAPIADDMAKVEATLRRELRSDYPFVSQLIEHGVRLSGKRLRPALLLLTARACGPVTEGHITLGAVVEMIHTATLVHDDVLDEADVRRHSDTVNAAWGNEASVLLGDFLFTHAFYLSSTLETTYACREIGRSTNIVCEGELRQIENRSNYELSEAEYVEIIDAKTAELCACSCRLGAHFAGADLAVVEAMTSFGRELGIAFQIADDLLDLLGDEASMGKSLGTDLEKQKPTLPLIRFLATAQPAQLDEMNQIMESAGDERRRAMLLLLESTDAIDYAKRRALEHIERGRAHLSQLSPSSERDALDVLAQFVLDRDL